MSELPQLSVVVPVHNEEDNVAPLVAEIVAALRGRVAFEIVYVDDASRDATLQRLRELQATTPELRVVRHLSNAGQSTAVRNGVKAARAPWIATLDGDGQNDPADIPGLLAKRDASPAGVKLFAGWRVNRQDSGIKLFERDAFLDLPYFDHMHRYLPALVQRAGWETVSVPVNHRHRTAGVSKYNNLGRAVVGIRDLFGVAWLIQRSRRTAVEELPGGSGPR